MTFHAHYEEHGPQLWETRLTAVLWLTFHIFTKAFHFLVSTTILPSLPLLCNTNGAKEQQWTQSGGSKYNLTHTSCNLRNIPVLFSISSNYGQTFTQTFYQITSPLRNLNMYITGIITTLLTWGGVMWTLSLPPTNNRTVDVNLVFVFITCGGCFSIMNVLQYTNKYLGM